MRCDINECPRFARKHMITDGSGNRIKTAYCKYHWSMLKGNFEG